MVVSDRYILGKWDKDSGYMSVYCGSKWTKGISNLFPPRYFTLLEVQDAIKNMSSFFTEEHIIAIPEWAVPPVSEEKGWD